MSLDLSLTQHLFQTLSLCGAKNLPPAISFEDEFELITLLSDHLEQQMIWVGDEQSLLLLDWHHLSLIADIQITPKAFETDVKQYLDHSPYQIIDPPSRADHAQDLDATDVDHWLNQQMINSLHHMDAIIYGINRQIIPLGFAAVAIAQDDEVTLLFFEYSTLAERQLIKAFEGCDIYIDPIFIEHPMPKDYQVSFVDDPFQSPV